MNCLYARIPSLDDIISAIHIVGCLEHGEERADKGQGPRGRQRDREVGSTTGIVIRVFLSAVIIGLRGVSVGSRPRSRLRPRSRSRSRSRSGGVLSRLKVGISLRLRSLESLRAGEIEQRRGRKVLGDSKLHLVLGVGIAK